MPFTGRAAVPDRAVLVPTAERDPAIGLAVFAPVFRGVRALMYNSHEERAMIRHVAQNDDVPGVVVGVGSDVPEGPRAERFRQQSGITAPFAIYVGRIDENKGCTELFDFFERYSRTVRGDLHLVLVGKTILPIPKHPRIHHLGFLPDEQKFDAMAAADLLIMPSVLREPLDGRARSLGYRQAGARQRAMRRAEGPGDPEQRGAVLRELRRVRGSAPCHHVGADAAARRSGGTAARTSAPTTRGP